MKVTGVAWQGYALPFVDQYSTSTGSARLRSGLLVWLRTADGIVGVGEASPVGPGTERDVREAASALEMLSARLLRAGTEEIPVVLKHSSPEVRFGLDAALLDIEGQAEGCAIAVLLGGKPSTFSVNTLIAASTPQQAVAAACEAVKQGFSSLKLKVAQGTLAQDEALVSAVRQSVGPVVKLRLDPNQAWSVQQAIAAISRLSRFDIEYVEQPVRDITGLAEVRRAVFVPIAADESLASMADLHRLLDAGAADLFILKAARLGGLRPTLDIARAALEAGKPVVVTSSLESSIGIAASAHLASALPPSPFARGLATAALFKHDLASPAVLLEKGMLSTPGGPGLGRAPVSRAV